MLSLSANLRRLRKRAGLTQAALAARCKLPRATLASLEQDGANPSLRTVVEVARALDTGLDDLLSDTPDRRHYKITPADMQDYRADRGQFSARLVSPIASKGVQIHHVTLLPGCRSIGRPHPEGAQEFFYTLSGTAVLAIDQDEVSVEAGCLVQFPGHRRHIYINRGRSTATAISAVVLRM